MREAIEKAIINSVNRGCTNPSLETDEMILYVTSVAQKLSLNPETITSLTVDMMKNRPNLSFSQAVQFAFRNAPPPNWIDIMNKVSAKPQEKPTLLKKKPILLKKRRIIIGKLF
jgi:hypothetical protein